VNDEIDDDAVDDDASNDDAPDDDQPPGYAWSVARQEAELPAEEYRLHRAILDEFEEEDLEGLDLSRTDDYILWAAAQAFDEIDRRDEAAELVRRIVASVGRHPALHYPDILFFHAGLLRDRGDYDEALATLDRAERQDATLRDDCAERRAEILVLCGRAGEGRRMFESLAAARRDDPWLPLTAGWAFLQAGDYGAARDWAERGEKALRRASDRGTIDEDDARAAATEIDRVREEAAARNERRGTKGAGGAARGAAGAPPTAPAGLADEILALLDAEEARLVQRPPRTAAEREEAERRLRALHARASRAWDDAVEADDHALIARFDDLQWEIVGLAERFGMDIDD
jgi:tetratricopeptide (TPR) repeat protein